MKLNNHPLQIVCDSELIIEDIDATKAGSAHDSFVWATSSLGQSASQGELDGHWLLGDSDYPCRPWLLTPLLVADTPAEERYNRCAIWVIGPASP